MSFDVEKARKARAEAERRGVHDDAHYMHCALCALISYNRDACDEIDALREKLALKDQVREIIEGKNIDLVNKVDAAEARLKEVEKQRDAYRAGRDVWTSRFGAEQTRSERLREALERVSDYDIAETRTIALQALAADSATPSDCDSCEQTPCICADVVVCPACSRAGGAERAISHLPPVCRDRDTGEQGGEPPVYDEVRVDTIGPREIPGIEAENEKLRADLAKAVGQVGEWATKAGALNAEVQMLRGALEFYADPVTYFAIGFLPDRPCGDFIDDFSDDHFDIDFDRAMPGKRAREALQATESEAL